MKLIVGLGNPGEKYKNNRHNAGYLFVDALNKSNLPKGVIAKKSGIFMNSSGEMVSNLYTKYKIQSTDLYVVHDDLDLHLGEYKIQFGVGPKLHYGIQSIDKALSTKDYWRIRIGVDDRKQREPALAKATTGKEYVLQNFTEEEKEIISRVIKEAAKSLTERLGI